MQDQDEKEALSSVAVLIIALSVFVVFQGCGEASLSRSGSAAGGAGGFGETANPDAGLPGTGGDLGSAGAPGSGGIAGAGGTTGTGGMTGSAGTTGTGGMTGTGGTSGTGGNPLPPPDNPDLYFHSTEPGCDGSDQTVLWCDDFEDGSFIETCSSGGHECCDNALCQQNGAGRNNPNNDGWTGNAYTAWPDPRGTAWGRCGGVGAGSNCAATSGQISGSAEIMGRKRFSPNDREVSEVYVRWYLKQLPGFDMGHEKMMTFEDNHGSWRPVIMTKYFGGGCIKARNNSSGDGGLLHQNLGNELCLENGHWYYIEVRLRVSSAGQSDGIYELWMDDCGADGTACNGTAGTKRASHTGVNFNSNGRKIGVTWLENWGNPASRGEQYYDQFVVATRRVGPMRAR